ncbi:hypothetical protein [Curtobacterium luteum]|uniref:Uncharacterized protein n=1 Tax=Curtobacterium luteum TaxID=33881 RepID=A0A175RTE4_9MICO|nr:hypothetical protein [Curtobacterium luteum]KTR07095.1 hypothetical protein NS184_08205 [Curtobacterium luteum]
MSDDARRRVTPKRVLATAGVVVLVVGGAAWAVVSSRPPAQDAVGATPVAARTPAGAGVDPTAPWAERVPPVAGDLIPIDRSAAGHVSITRHGDGGLRITIDHFDVAWPSVEGPVDVGAVRVLLSDGQVVGDRRGYWAHHSEPVDVGTVEVRPTVVIDVPASTRLPADVRSLVLLRGSEDPEIDDRVIGGAALFLTE